MRFLSLIVAIMMKLVWMLPHFPGDLRTVLSRYFSTFNSDHNFSAWEIVENVYQSESSHCLTWEIKWTVKENADIPVSTIHIHLILLAEPSKFNCINVLRWLLVLHE